MKNLFLTLMLVLFSLVSMAQSGKVKVYFSGLICDRETWDDAMQLDGKGDEVFVSFQFAHADAQGNIKLAFENQTQTFGDATGGLKGGTPKAKSSG